MRQQQKSNRARGRGSRKGGGGGGSNVNRVYESAGPEGKVRGTPQQIVDKYLSLARDAQTSGDRVSAENFLQHAEHYQRLLIQAMGPQVERRESGGADDADEAGEAAGQETEETSGRSGEGDAPSQGRSKANGTGRRKRARTPEDEGLEASESGETPAEESSAESASDETRPADTARESVEIGGLTTIDTQEEAGGSAGDLLVSTEEDMPAKPKRRRSNGRAKADKAESAEEENTDTTAPSGE